MHNKYNFNYFLKEGHAAKQHVNVSMKLIQGAENL